jgi:DNA-binding MarR family transcriptional regulator
MLMQAGCGPPVPESPRCRLVVDPLKELPGYALRRASSAAMARLAERLQSLDVRVSDASVLLVIEANPEISQSEIGRLLDIAGANMAPLIGRLEARELVARQPIDGRSHALSLSRAGRALLAQVQKIIAAHEQALWNRIPAADRATFMRVLRAISDD